MIEPRLKEQARLLGFELVGIAAAAPADGFDRFQEWLDRGYAGEMNYMHRHAEARRHPSSILADVRSVIMVGLNYSDGSSLPDSTSARALPRGRVAKYARGPDYHDVMWKKLDELLEWLQNAVPGCQGRSVVDSAPLLERDFARRAGLGWFGKNTMLINKHKGSLFFLGALLVNIVLQSDAAHTASHCGTCTACLDACPTQAFTGPGSLDARRCISYLTIELRSAIPEELRSSIGDWMFGCDVCQDVCPWNAKRARTANSTAVDLDGLNPLEVIGLSDEEFNRRFRGTPLMRTKRRGLIRNAAIVLGNQGDPRALPALQRAQNDPEAVVREAAAWAIERILLHSAVPVPSYDRFSHLS